MERLNLVDRYDLICVRDKIEQDIIKQYNEEIYPCKKALQLHRTEIDDINKKLNYINEELKLHDRIMTNNHMNVIEKIKENDDLYYQVKNQIKDNVKRFNIIFYTSIICFLYFSIY
jgi:hypothetical protein